MDKNRRRSIRSDASRLDLAALNYRISSEKLRRYNRQLRSIRGRHPLYQAVRFVLSAIKQTAVRLFSRTEGPGNGDVVLFHATLNQRRALEPLAERIPRAVMLDGISNDVPLADVYRQSLPFIGRTWRERRKSTGYLRETFTAFFDEYIFIHGYYIVFRRIFADRRYRLAVVANDHAHPATTFIQAARDSGVPVVYIQHASVTGNFPPLTVDIALLEGKDAAEKYDTCGPSETTVYLVGMPRFDRHAGSVNRSGRLASLGICTNALDPHSAVERLATAIRASFPDMPVTLRPHPSDAGEPWKTICSRHGLSYSDPAEQSAFGYLGGIDCLVAGNSNILLEAALLNVTPVLYDFTGEGIDYYGFAKRGLVDGILSTPELAVEIITRLSESRPEVRSRTRLYNAVVSTHWDGKSADLAAKVIRGMLEPHSSVTLAGDVAWTPDTEYTHLRVLRPADQVSTANSSSTNDSGPMT